MTDGNREAGEQGSTTSPTQRDRVFISYRRSDAASEARALREVLANRLGGATVFMDVHAIEAGERFPERLRTELERSRVVLVVIGNGWITASNEYGQRRIDFDDDWVRIELSAALADEGVTVVPVLVNGANLPPADKLPSSLATLVVRNSIRLSDDSWPRDVDRLAGRIEQLSSADPAQRLDEVEQPPASVQETVRNAVFEVLRSPAALRPGAYVVATTVDSLSRMAASSTTELGSDESRVLLRRLVGQTVVEVSGYLEAMFQERFRYPTPRGVWLGYAHAAHAEYRGVTFPRSILVLPGAEGRVDGAVLAHKVEIDNYVGAGEGPIYGHQAAVEVGAGLGEGRFQPGSA